MVKHTEQHEFILCDYHNHRHISIITIIDFTIIQNFQSDFDLETGMHILKQLLVYLRLLLR